MSERSSLFLAYATVHSARYALGRIIAVLDSGGVVFSEDLEKLDRQLDTALELMFDGSSDSEKDDAAQFSAAQARVGARDRDH